MKREASENQRERFYIFRNFPDVGGSKCNQIFMTSASINIIAGLIITEKKGVSMVVPKIFFNLKSVNKSDNIENIFCLFGNMLKGYIS